MPDQKTKFYEVLLLARRSVIVETADEDEVEDIAKDKFNDMDWEITEVESVDELDPKKFADDIKSAKETWNYVKG